MFLKRILSLLLLLIVSLTGCRFFNWGATVSVYGTITIEHSWPGSVVSPSLQEGPFRQFTYDYGGDPETDLDNNQLIVGFHPHITRQERLTTLSAIGVVIIDSIDYLHAYLVEAPPGLFKADVADLAACSAVMYIEPNCTFIIQSVLPNDPLYRHQWHYPQIRLPQAWAVTKGAPWVRVAVIDTGIDAGHPDLINRIDTSSGYNFVDNDHNTHDYHGHGTHVAGIIGSETNNNEGVAGVMWESTLVPVKVLGNNGSGYYWDIAKGILYAAGLLAEQPISEPVHIINLSLGGASDSECVRDAVQAVADAGVIMVAASGNIGIENILYPARYPEVIAVGAVDFNYPHTPQKAYYSNYGDELDVVAPGGDMYTDSDGDDHVDGVLSTGKSYSYEFKSGTSMATPHVAGVIGLMLSNGIPAAEVREVLHRTSMDLESNGFNIYHGYGLINAYWAVSNVQAIKIIVGSKAGNIITAVAEKTIPLGANTFRLNNVPTGDYQVFAWIDVKGNNKIEPGDYLGVSELTLTDAEEYVVLLVLTEVD